MSAVKPLVKASERARSAYRVPKGHAPVTVARPQTLHRVPYYPDTASIFAAENRGLAIEPGSEESVGGRDTGKGAKREGGIKKGGGKHNQKYALRGGGDKTTGKVTFGSLAFHHFLHSDAGLMNDERRPVVVRQSFRAEATTEAVEFFANHVLRHNTPRATIPEQDLKTATRDEVRGSVDDVETATTATEGVVSQGIENVEVAKWHTLPIEWALPHSSTSTKSARMDPFGGLPSQPPAAAADKGVPSSPMDIPASSSASAGAGALRSQVSELPHHLQRPFSAHVSQLAVEFAVTAPTQFEFARVPAAAPALRHDVAVTNPQWGKCFAPAVPTYSEVPLRPEDDDTRIAPSSSSSTSTSTSPSLESKAQVPAHGNAGEKKKTGLPGPVLTHDTFEAVYTTTEPCALRLRAPRRVNWTPQQAQRAPTKVERQLVERLNEAPSHEIDLATNKTKAQGLSTKTSNEQSPQLIVAQEKLNQIAPAQKPLSPDATPNSGEKYTVFLMPGDLVYIPRLWKYRFDRVAAPHLSEGPPSLLQPLEDRETVVNRRARGADKDGVLDVLRWRFDVFPEVAPAATKSSRGLNTGASASSSSPNDKSTDSNANVEFDSRANDKTQSNEAHGGEGQQHQLLYSSARYTTTFADFYVSGGKINVGMGAAALGAGGGGGGGGVSSVNGVVSGDHATTAARVAVVNDAAAVAGQHTRRMSSFETAAPRHGMPHVSSSAPPAGPHDWGKRPTNM